MIKLTHDNLLECGSLNKTQAELLGVHWPLVQGWKWGLIGKHILESTWDHVLAVRGLKPKDRKRVMRLEKQGEMSL